MPSAPHLLDSDFVRDQLVAAHHRRQRQADAPRRRLGAVLDAEHAAGARELGAARRHSGGRQGGQATGHPSGARPLVPARQRSAPSPHPARGPRHGRRAEQAGLSYQFVLRERRDDDRRVVDRLAEQAYVVITDRFPTAGVDARTWRLAERVGCRVLAVDGACVVPSGVFTKAEWAARTIRPKLAKLRDHALERVEERPPRHALTPALQQRCTTRDSLTRCHCATGARQRGGNGDRTPHRALRDRPHVAPVTELVPGARAAQERLAILRARTTARVHHAPQ
jgi:deoxyribodipyrimidine photo-lyase